MMRLNGYIGGLAWPYLEQPGFLVIMGIYYDPNDATIPYRARVLHDYEDIDVVALYRDAMAWMDEHDDVILEIHGDAMNLAMYSLIAEHVENADRLPFIPAPYIDSPTRTATYLQAIRQCVLPETNRISFGDSSLPGLMQAFPKDWRGSIEHHPPMAALGYAVSAMVLEMQLKFPEKSKTIAERIIEQAELKTRAYDDYKQYWTNEELLEVRRG